MNASPLAHVELDLGRGAVQLSENFARVCGIEPAGDAARDASAFRACLAGRIAADELLRLGRIALALTPQHPVARLEVALAGDDRQARQFDVVVHAAFSPDGRPASALIALCRGGTETALRIERERLTQALNTGRMGAYDLDMRDGTLWWSPQTHEILGTDPQTFRPDAYNVVDLVHPDDRVALVQGRAEALKARRPFELDYRVVRPDGALIWIGHRGLAEYAPDGRVVRSFGIVMDITARKQVEEELREADRMKDRFVATLAHELRNPLAPVRNAAEILRRVPHGNDRIDWCREVIERQVAQMAHLLDDLLDASRITRGQLLLRPSSLELSVVIEQALEIAQPTIDAARHTLALSLPAATLRVHGDLTRLAQLFSNLLINAAKYTPAGGRIAVLVEAAGREVTVRVRDSGVGIAPEQLPQLFRMFAQVGPAVGDGVAPVVGPAMGPAVRHSRGGVGIGLWLAKGLAELHGGRIAAHSAGLGQGSEFTVWLPLRADDGLAADGTAAQAPARPASAGRRVLVVDDLRDSADSLRLMLESQGHEVVVAYGGEEALRLADAWRPEVVLLDIGMPELDGHAVCRRLREQPWGAALVLIAQTGWGTEDDRRRTREAGFDHHMVKPVDPILLAQLMARKL